jgi:hypothetical protein
MITARELKDIARARLKDSEVLYKQKRYDGAFYLCGYAVELALKARVCRTLKWKGFPTSNKEFEGLLSFRVHKLEMLLRLSGMESKITQSFLADWSIVAAWDPESRYRSIWSASKNDAFNMIESTKKLLGVL